MPALTRDQILSADDLKKELVSVPEWGGDVWVRTLTGDKRDQFEALIVEQQTVDALYGSGIRARFAAWTICDEKGNLLFTEDDVAELGKKSSAALDRVFEVCQRLNHLSAADVDELAKV